MAWIIQIALVVLVLIAAYWDLRHRRIPNALTGSGLVAGFLLNIFLFEWQGLKIALFGFMLAAAIYFPLYLLRAMGAGDVKLMAAVGSFAGAAHWFGVFMATSILGGVAAMILLLHRRRLRRALSNVGFIFQSLAAFRAPYANEELDVTSDKAVRLPHGVLIACGTITFLLILRITVQ